MSQNTVDDGMILIPSSMDDEDLTTRPQEDIFAFAERQYSGSFNQKNAGVIEVETKERGASISVENEE